jgi:hypothetical protein
MRVRPWLLCLAAVACGGRQSPAQPSAVDDYAIYSEAVTAQLFGYIKDGARGVVVARDTLVPVCPALSGQLSSLPTLTPDTLASFRAASQKSRRLEPRFQSIYQVELVDNATADPAAINRRRPGDAGFAELSAFGVDAAGKHALLYFRHDREGAGYLIHLELRFGRWWEKEVQACAGP